MEKLGEGQVPKKREVYATLALAVAASLRDGYVPIVKAKHIDRTGTNPYELARNLGAYVRYDQTRLRYTFKPGD